MITRRLLGELKKHNKSVLLLGPRQTGKSTLIAQLQPDMTVNLATEATFLQFAQNPSELEERIAKTNPKTIFIDEVQRLPRLLNTVQVLLDSNPKRRFFLTGSSARKLKRGKANLLPGRVLSYFLGGLVSSELKDQVDTEYLLSTGSLPGIYTEENEALRRKILLSYAATYLREEVQAEALTRNLEGFARFLKILAAYAGKVIDLSKLASLSQVPRQSTVRYLEILEDTLLVSCCSVFTQNMSVKMTTHPKYYWFDTGVLNGLLKNFSISEDRKGFLFENLIYTQLLHSAWACDKPIEISFYRTEGGAEVDFIVEFDNRILAIEAKATSQVTKEATRGLKSFAENYSKKHESYVFYTGREEKRIEGVFVLPWQKGLKEIGF